MNKITITLTDNPPLKKEDLPFWECWYDTNIYCNRTKKCKECLVYIESKLFKLYEEIKNDN